jgi:hypothetical protein
MRVNTDKEVEKILNLRQPLGSDGTSDNRPIVVVILKDRFYDYWLVEEFVFWKITTKNQINQ